MVHLPDGSADLSRPQGPTHGPTSPACAATSTTPAGAAEYTARRPAARLAAAGRLPILGRLSAPGAFLRVPQERPAKHQPDHYRRDEPGGQADQHPRPRAHPAPQANIPDTGRALYPLHDQPCRSAPAERRYRAPLRSRACTGAGTTPTGWLLPAHVIGRAGSLRAIHGGGLRRCKLPWPRVEQRMAMSPPRPSATGAPVLLHPRLVPRPVPHRPAGPARCAAASMKGKAAVGADACAGGHRPGGSRTASTTG